MKRVIKYYFFIQQIFGWNRYKLVEVRLRCWLPLSAVIGSCSSLSGFVGAIYWMENSTIASNITHCFYILAFDLGTAGLISQGFAIVYSTISLESMMHNVLLPTWTATSYLACCLVMFTSAIVVDICAAFMDRTWVRTIFTFMLTVVELFLAITAATAYWNVDKQITETITFMQTSGVVVSGSSGQANDELLIGQRRVLRMNALMQVQNMFNDQQRLNACLLVWTIQ